MSAKSEELARARAEAKIRARIGSGPDPIEIAAAADAELRRREAADIAVISEALFLRWLWPRLDFGPATEDVMEAYARSYTYEGGLLPPGYVPSEEEEEERT